MDDSLSAKAIEAYKINLLARYGLEPCENIPLQSGKCDVFEIKKEALIVRQPELLKMILQSKQRISVSLMMMY